MDRREFLQVSAATAVGLILGEHFISAEDLLDRGVELIGPKGVGKRASKMAQKEAYSIVMLGDTHFDKGPDSVYHIGYELKNKAREARHLKESEAYGKMWQERMPRLLKRAAALADPSTVLALQLGDLVQGDSGTREEHIKMLSDAYSTESSAFSPIPLVTVTGNHDVRGKSDKEARAAYEEYMCARMTDATGKTVDKTTFGFWIGPDAFIVIDFNIADDDTLDSILEETKDARYTFVAVHGPLFPYESYQNADWILHGPHSGASEETRKRYYEIFSRRNAIVLCGHTHKTEFIDWIGENGRITQMTMSSVWKTKNLSDWNIQCEGADKYGSIATEQAIEAGEKISDKIKALFEQYRPGIKSYLHSNTIGSYKMNVSPKGITIDFFPGDDKKACRKFTLR